MMYKPGTNELECLWVGLDKLGNLVPRKVCAISEMGQWHT